jgi:hypothetical protein
VLHVRKGFGKVLTCLAWCFLRFAASTLAVPSHFRSGPGSFFWLVPEALRAAPAAIVTPRFAVAPSALPTDQLAFPIPLFMIALTNTFAAEPISLRASQLSAFAFDQVPGKW